MGVTVSFTVILYLKFFLKKTDSPIHVLHETKTTVKGDSTANGKFRYKELNMFTAYHKQMTKIILFWKLSQYKVCRYFNIKISVAV